MNSLYDRFADIYAAGPYPRYTQRIIEVFPALLERYAAPTSGKLLDIACGEGTFAAAMAASGWQVTGVDQSERMLQYAKARAQSENLTARFLQQDMREPVDEEEFDVATCWFDSLNYLLHIGDLKQAFGAAYTALRPGGYYLCDLNTLYGLAYHWQQRDVYMAQDTENLLEIHAPSYDYEKQIATLRITGFILLPEINLWERVDEVHRERGYPIEQITSTLESVGFEVVGLLGSLQEFTPPDSESGRAWWICRKAEI